MLDEVQTAVAVGDGSDEPDATMFEATLKQQVGALCKKATMEQVCAHIVGLLQNWCKEAAGAVQLQQRQPQQQQQSPPLGGQCAGGQQGVAGMAVDPPGVPLPGQGVPTKGARDRSRSPANVESTGDASKSTDKDKDGKQQIG